MAGMKDELRVRGPIEGDESRILTIPACDSRKEQSRVSRKIIVITSHVVFVQQYQPTYNTNLDKDCLSIISVHELGAAPCLWHPKMP